jgi:hypothetical protein
LGWPYPALPGAQLDRELFGDGMTSPARPQPRSSRIAERDGADMLVLGTAPIPIPSRRPTIGLAVRAVCRPCASPHWHRRHYSENAGDVIRAGASGVAVISATDAPDPRAAAAELAR